MDGRYLTFRRLGYNLFGGLLITVPKLTLRLVSVFQEMLMERDVLVGLGMKTIGSVQFSKTRAAFSDLLDGQLYPNMRRLPAAQTTPRAIPLLPASSQPTSSVPMNLTLRNGPRSYRAVLK
ncbi:hypothetical protein DSO57_1025095 [Entomophthora muscae]|uniref:Uncharacterized protein n=1 Tax=Entomophthora muscae TaxID=34485 RepID=A0ACC2TDA1_9FUNG|nr:hypothetical protein DSO57_1025095 [Entomophthora muscae]